MKSLFIVALLIAFAAAAPVCEESQFGCTSCKIVVQSIEKMIASNKTEEFIIKSVEQYVLVQRFLRSRFAVSS